MNPNGSKLRIAIAGVGRFGALHGRAWTEAGAELVGISDPSTARLAEVGDVFGVAVRTTGLPELLAAARPDAVVIASDEDTHAELALTALAAGCHVFVEKPLAQSSDEAWAIHRRTQEVERKVVVGNISRFATPYARMRDTLRRGDLGELYTLRLRRDFSNAWYQDFGDRVHPVWESMIHDIDLAISFAAAPVTSLVAVRSEAAGEDADAVISALLRFETGVTATVESSWLLPASTPVTLDGLLELGGAIVASAELLGSAGVVRQQLGGEGLVEWCRTGARHPDLVLWPEENGRVGGALRSEVEHAIGQFSGSDQPPVMPLEQACWGIEVAEAMVASLDAGGRPVPVGRRGANVEEP
jgi:predicted dehydrogenase